MMIDSSTRTPKPGDLAHWDPTGTRVLCGRRLADGTCCRAVLALLDAGTSYGSPYRQLRFPHRAWVQINGVWRVPTSTKLRLQQGWAPRAQDGIGPQRVTVDGSEGAGLVVPELPAVFRCPNSRCGELRTGRWRCLRRRALPPAPFFACWRAGRRR